MGQATAQLIDGFKVGEAIHKEAELRLPTAGDVIEAGLESERAVLTPAGYVLLMSPTLVAQHVLCRQVVRIGTHQGPLTLAELKKLSERDLQLLQQLAAQLDSATDDAIGALFDRGRPAAPGQGAGGR